MNIITKLSISLYYATGMLWDMLWALILGFALSAMTMTFISRSKISKNLGQPGIKQIGLATFLGAISSSCSYAAVSVSRSLFQKGAHIVPALAFMVASTNLVLELSLVLWNLLGWPFVLAEFLGGLILITIMSLLIITLKPFVGLKRNGGDIESHGGDLESHGGDFESPGGDSQSLDNTEDIQSIFSFQGWIAVGQNFISEGRMIFKDILIGVALSGILMAFVPDSFWETLFLQDSAQGNFSFLRVLENAAVGPLVSMLSFVCSIGNIPLAGVLFHSGISFGGTLSFIYADLIIIPLLLIYKKYYGVNAALKIFVLLYSSMVITGVIVDYLFHLLNWIPERELISDMQAMHFFRLNYTSYLNFIFIILGFILFLLSRKGESKGESCCHA